MKPRNQMPPERALDHLNWLISSPLLVESNLAQQLHDEDLDPQILKNASPSEMRTLLSSIKRVTLGHYFEALVGYWLNNRSDIKILAQNLPLTDEGNTIGEFDLLYEKEKTSYHVELAIKFYLSTGDRKLEKSWVGPGRRDRLDIKLDHMRGHQLLLGQRKSARAIFDEMQINSLTAFPFVKGMLFHHFDDWNSNDIIHPASISPAHSTGWWVSLDDLSHTKRYSGTHWTFLDKPEWISAQIDTSNFEIHDISNLTSTVRNRFDTDESPALIAIGSLQKPGILCSISKGFIVPGGWQKLSM